MSKDNNIIIVGGGIGGLTSAALLASKQIPVTILEASNEWGGCAGKFSRGPYTFPVGATLGMGFQNGGIHDRILRHLQIDLPVTHLTKIMKVTMPRVEIDVLQDRQEHVKELQSTFPNYKDELKSFYTTIFSIAIEVQKLMKRLPILPPTTIREWVQLVRSLAPSNIRFFPFFNKTICDIIKEHNLHSCEAFVHFLNGQLIDSMQTTSEDSHSIIGALALDIYHQGASYVQGGLFQLAEALKISIIKNGGFPLLRQKVVSIDRKDKEWIVIDQKGKVRTTRHIVFNTPIQQLSHMIKPELYQKLSLKLQKKSRTAQWGAFTLYLAVEDKVIPEDTPLFQQILVNDKGMTEGDHLFVSISKKRDHLRAPKGNRTITVSTHTDLAYWKNAEQSLEMKKVYTERMVSALKNVFPTLEDGIIHCIPGTPHTWEKFTHRPKGMVGGFPQTKEHSLFNSISHRTPLPNFWLCGDSIFPGAGTIGVSVSAYHVFQSITGGKYKI